MSFSFEWSLWKEKNQIYAKALQNYPQNHLLSNMLDEGISKILRPSKQCIINKLCFYVLNERNTICDIFRVHTIEFLRLFSCRKEGKTVRKNMRKLPWYNSEKSIRLIRVNIKLMIYLYKKSEPLTNKSSLNWDRGKKLVFTSAGLPWSRFFCWN